MPPKKPPKSEPQIRIKVLLSLQIAPGLLYGDRSHALQMYRQADHGRIRTEIERIVGHDMKILSFEDKEKIGRCQGHPWGNLVAAHVLNIEEGKECILITIYDDASISPSSAIQACAGKANWGIVPECNP